MISSFSVNYKDGQHDVLTDEKLLNAKVDKCDCCKYDNSTDCPTVWKDGKSTLLCNILAPDCLYFK